MSKEKSSSYTKVAMKDSILLNIVDEDTKREVLNTQDFLPRSSFEIIAFIETKKMGRHVTELSLCISGILVVVL